MYATIQSCPDLHWVFVHIYVQCYPSTSTCSILLKLSYYNNANDKHLIYITSSSTADSITLINILISVTTALQFVKIPSQLHYVIFILPDLVFYFLIWCSTRKKHHGPQIHDKHTDTIVVRCSGTFIGVPSVFKKPNWKKKGENKSE